MFGNGARTGSIRRSIESAPAGRSSSTPRVPTRRPARPSPRAASSGAAPSYATTLTARATARRPGTGAPPTPGCPTSASAASGTPRADEHRVHSKSWMESSEFVLGASFCGLEPVAPNELRTPNSEPPLELRAHVEQQTREAEFDRTLETDVGGVVLLRIQPDLQRVESDAGAEGVAEGVLQPDAEVGHESGVVPHRNPDELRPLAQPEVRGERRVEPDPRQRNREEEIHGLPAVQGLGVDFHRRSNAVNSKGEGEIQPIVLDHRIAV